MLPTAKYNGNVYMIIAKMLQHQSGQCASAVSQRWLAGSRGRPLRTLPHAPGRLPHGCPVKQGSPQSSARPTWCSMRSTAHSRASRGPTSPAAAAAAAASSGRLERVVPAGGSSVPAADPPLCANRWLPGRGAGWPACRLPAASRPGTPLPSRPSTDRGSNVLAS